MKLDDCRYDGSKKFDLSKYPTSAKMSKKLKPEYAEMRESMYKYLDHNNSQRTCDEIMKRNW